MQVEKLRRDKPLVLQQGINKYSEIYYEQRIKSFHITSLIWRAEPWIQ